MDRVAGLLLAAGTSTRMGSPKQLLATGGLSLLDRILAETLESDLDLVVLVLGHRAGEIIQGVTTDLHHPKLRLTQNKEYRDGISASIRAGLSGVEAEADHAMIILADMPRITSGIINQLLRQYLTSGCPLGAIKTKRGRSHPVIVSRRFYPELHQLKGDTGARELFLKHADRVLLVEPREAYDDRDIDTPEDYIEFEKSLRDEPD